MPSILQLLLGGSQQAPAVDPYFYSVTSLLHGDGTNGAQNNTFLDSSTNNFTITRNGNTTQGSFSPFSQTGWGNYFDGTANGFLSTPPTTDLDLSGDFTLQAWIFPTAASQANGSEILSRGAPTTFNGWHWYYYNNKLNFSFNYGGFLGANNTTIPLNVWTHVALTRSGNTFTYYLNGVADGTFTSSGTPTTNVSDVVYVGRASYDTTNRQFPGYMAQVSVIKGTALTTFNTTTPLSTSTSGQSLLTCTSNRFIDTNTATTAKTITAGSGASVQPFSPFNPTTAYSTSAVGGSGYFDGSGDYLTAPDSSAFFYDSGAFTIETWIYFNSMNTTPLLQQSNGDGFTLKWTWYYNNATNNLVFTGHNPAPTPLTWISSSTTLVPGTWYHLVVVRDGSNNWAQFVNGTRIGTATTATAVPDVSSSLFVNYFTDSPVGASWAPLNGYLSNTRVVKGTAVYSPTSSTLTVPTAPLTAITNTSLLLNYTNAGIFDNAADADYETVGNAQISTSVKKYGTGSMAFDGTGDYLVTDAPSSQAYVFGTGDFTIECWVYFNSVASGSLFEFRPASTNGAYPLVYFSSSGVLTYYANTGARISSSAVTTGVWYHFALCRVASQTRMFINGTQTGATYADTSNYLCRANGPLIGVTSDLSSDALNGYIDDFRITKGIGRYPYNFTPPTAEFPNIGGTVTLTADPYYDYTTLLLPGNGTNGAQNNTFLDSSTNAFSITRNGNTTQGTFSPFSQTGWGNYFDGTGDSLTVPAGSAFAYGTGAFTVETWIYPTVGGVNQIVFSQTVSGTNYFVFSLNTSNQLEFVYATSGGGTTVTGATVQLNQWSHVAAVREGTGSNQFKLYVNGTVVATSTVAQDFTNTTYVPTIGQYTHSATLNWNGYISNLRIVKGTAVYTANFTPSTTPLTAITNTSLLTCQSNRFIDNSSNAFAITRNGDVSVQAFSPFNPTAAWSAATYGGSGYFDGSGDYLTVANSANYALGTSDFTIELWWYPTASFSNGLTLFSHGYVSYCPWLFYTNVSNGLLAYASSSGSSWDVLNAANFGTVTINAWNHIALCRSGSTFYLCLNGVVTSTATSSASLMSIASGLTIGATTSGIGVISSSYITNARIIKGTALYTGAYTLPTAPLTPVTNTQFLLSATNAGIYDATSKNDLETVGNAQISTAQSKFGGSSMYFDGTGDYLVAPASVDTDFGSGDFTAEAWVYPSSFSSAMDVFGKHADSPVGNSTVAWFVYIGASNSANEASIVSGSTVYSVTGWSLAQNQWQHIAFTRFNGSLRFFINGVQVGSTVSANVTINSNTAWRTWVGTYTAASRNWNGYLQDVRFTKGIARYTSNFTPPTTAFLTL